MHWLLLSAYLFKDLLFAEPLQSCTVQTHPRDSSSRHCRPLQPRALQEPPPVTSLARKHVPHRTWTAAPSQQVASHPSETRCHTWVSPPYCPAGSRASNSCRGTPSCPRARRSRGLLPCTLIVIRVSAPCICWFYWFRNLFSETSHTFQKGFSLNNEGNLFWRVRPKLQTDHIYECLAHLTIWFYEGTQDSLLKWQSLNFLIKLNKLMYLVITETF